MCNSKTLLPGVILLLFAGVSAAQTFTEVAGTPFTGVAQSAIAFADVDGDNDQDVLITGLNFDGQPPGVRIAKLYTNDGSGNFTEVVNTPFDGVEEGSIAFADVDGDNDQDVLITGRSDAGFSAKLYINDGLGNFTEAVGTPFLGVNESSVAFADVDGDNDQDVLITGIQVASPVYISTSRLYINDGSGNFSEMMNAPFDGVRDGAIAFADVDGDNDHDVLITGNAEPNGYISKLYTNDGAGGFTEAIGTPFHAVHYGAIAFADVDGDNDLDVVITGSDGFESSSRLYTNDGVGNFTEIVGTPFPGLEGSAIAFADADCDGDLDLLMSGGTTIFTLEYTGLFVNDGLGTFTEADAPFEDLVNGSVTFADVDGDGDQDVLLTGQDPVNYVAELYLNEGEECADCNIAFSLGPDATLNCGETTLLSAPAGYTYLWNTGATTQSIEVIVSGTYSCTISEGEAQQTVVLNGDFSNGNTDFGTDYAPGTGGAFGVLSAAGQYALAANPSDVHTNFLSCFDHTVGDATGSMIIVNGAALPNFRVWFQTVDVTPDTDYQFSFWAMPVANVNNSLPELFLTVNGNQVGDAFLLTDNSCDWQSYSTQWNSGANTSVEIAIVNQSISPSGNDFAIDDIAFTAVFCEFTDEIEITVPSIPEVSVDEGTSICAGQNIVLNAQSDVPGSTFTWQPGNLTGPSINVAPDLDTEYTVFATSPQNCDSEPMSAVVEVFEEVNVDISGPVELCQGEEETLTATAGDFSYLWNNGENTNSITISDGGDYWVEVTDLQSGCQSTAVYSVVGLSLPSVTLPESLELCEDSEEVILAVSDNNSDLVWQDGTEGGSYTIASEGSYTIFAATVCGTIFETIEVVEVNCEQTLFIPNAFTPDGDGLNDIFKVMGHGVVSLNFKVYNRWGDLVFATNDIGEGWNGSYNNGDYYVSNDSYVYVAHVGFLDGSIETYRGHVSVIR